MATPVSGPRRDHRSTPVGFDLYPGDVVLFSGLTPIHRLVQKLSKSSWTQVGIIIFLSPSSQPMLFESTSIPLAPDIKTGRLKTGVRTAALGTKLDAFQGTAAVRNIRPRLEAASVARLMEFRRSVEGRPFNFSLSYSRDAS
jgi:hypothetical protein